jgi:hypothetical protein
MIGLWKEALCAKERLVLEAKARLAEKTDAFRTNNRREIMAMQVYQ